LEFVDCSDDIDDIEVDALATEEAQVDDVEDREFEIIEGE